MDSDNGSVSDNDSDDSETIIMLKSPLKKPETLESMQTQANISKIEESKIMGCIENVNELK